MYASHTVTNTGGWDRILQVMTQEVNYSPSWTAVGAYKPRYQAPTRRIVKATVKRKIAWSRVLLPLLALACISAYKANSNVEQQYHSDWQNVYSKVAASR